MQLITYSSLISKPISLIRRFLGDDESQTSGVAVSVEGNFSRELHHSVSVTVYRKAVLLSGKVST